MLFFLIVQFQLNPQSYYRFYEKCLLLENVVECCLSIEHRHHLVQLVAVDTPHCYQMTIFQNAVVDSTSARPQDILRYFIVIQSALSLGVRLIHTELIFLDSLLD